MPLHPLAENPLVHRRDVQELVRALIAPVIPHFSPAGARVKLGTSHAWYGEPGDLIEGFSRTLWGMVPLHAGGGAADLSRWREGLAAGTDPNHAEFWGWPGDFDQRIVEMAPVALGMLLTPLELWESLDPENKAHVARWLEQVNSVRPVNSNWLFFRILVNLALRRHGLKWSMENVKADLAGIDSFYLGDGWYSDGLESATLRDGRQGDYYIPMGMHYYGLLFAKFAPDLDPEHSSAFLARARRFATDFIHYFAADGSAVPFGRSLTYRFAQGAFWGALAFADVDAVPWGIAKGLYLRHLRWWMKRPILSDSGLLTIGYGYPNIIPAESYNGPGSPYWALKTFLPLALPQDHPFWSADEEPFPKRRMSVTFPQANLILNTKSDGSEVVALSAGQKVGDWPRHAPHKYSKFAYSTRFSFSVPVGSPTPPEGGFDSVLSLSDDRRWYRHRDTCFDAAVENGVAFSRWRPWPDVEVATWLLAENNGHLRVHRISSARSLWSLEGGFAIGYDDRRTVQTKKEASRVEVISPCASSGLVDFFGGRHTDTVELGVNSHLLFPLSIMPVLTGQHVPGQFWLVCWAEGKGLGQRAEKTGSPTFDVKIDQSDCIITRDQAPWWRTSEKVCGVSSQSRLSLLESLVP